MTQCSPEQRVRGRSWGGNREVTGARINKVFLEPAKKKREV